ncbi:hypothetical protein [Curtobacterium sp. MCJR17_020]|uniref:hypothetical protein n=1 Tax=Curtobacterium sp. MCJR17_020 TaxID=2175619 RepID=UPI000DAA2445|nr:hypothetical protein [Curtobacterium sp. MCJR17_020]WIE71419.1 hypothetical protein DEJ14_014690 [Curtobacterium sp. MCJR17_020]
MNPISDIVIPVAAILVPTAIAIWLARSERKSAERSRYLERRTAAAEPIILSLAQFISLDPVHEPIQAHLRELRGRIAVYRTTLDTEDALSGDWLALQHERGMLLWWSAMQTMDGSTDRSEAFILGAFSEGRTWANATMQTLSGWLAGHISDDVLKRQGAALMKHEGETSEA